MKRKCREFIFANQEREFFRGFIMDGPSPKFESEFFNLCHSCVLVTLMTMDSPTPLVNSPTPLANLLTTSVNLLCQHQVLLHKLLPKTTVTELIYGVTELTCL